MLCIACARVVARPLCTTCRQDMVSGPRVVLRGGLAVVAAYRHHGAARRLVHRVKYEGLTSAAALLAEAMVPNLPSGATCLAPVPRAVGRRLRYGVDPAVELAHRIGAAAGLEVVTALRPGLWWPRHAARDPVARRPVPFRPLSRPLSRSGLVLVDDVVTTGATLLAASQCVGSLLGAVTATAPSTLVTGAAAYVPA